MRSSFKLAAMLAALGVGLGGGAETLREMYTPRFNLPGPFMPESGKARKRAHNCSRSRRPNYTTDWRGAPGHREAARRVARGQHGDSWEFNKRMAWNERNAHVLAKRAADQLKADGRNMIVWGRR